MLLLMYRRATLLVIGIVIGWVRILAAPLAPAEGDIASLTGRHISGLGTVSGYPEARQAKQRVVIELQAESTKGKVITSLPRSLVLEPGTQVRVTGTVAKPPEFPGFDYRAYLAKDGIHSQLTGSTGRVVSPSHSPVRWLYQVRKSFERQLLTVFPREQGSFLLGIVIGDRSGISDELEAAFQKTGTTHLLALSGFNISILVAVIVGILGRTPGAVVVTVVLLVLFVALVGASASVVRAGLMGALILISQLLGRPQEALRLCIMAAACLLLVNPWALRYDLGFDLSFLATLGILTLAAPLATRLWWVPRGLREIIAATFAAGIPTLPLIVYSFGTLSLSAPLANALAVPLVPWLMLGAFAATAVSYFIMPAAGLLAAVTDAVAGGLLHIIKSIASTRWAAVVLPARSLTWSAGMMLLCGWGAWRLSRPTARTRAVAGYHHPDSAEV